MTQPTAVFEAHQIKREFSGGLQCLMPALALTLFEIGASVSPAAQCNGPATLTDLGDDGRIGVKWNGPRQEVAFGRAQKDGRFHTFASRADGSNEQRVTATNWRDDRHQFPAAWHLSGRYLAMQVEKDEHAGSATDAIPGYGAYTDYWLVAREGGQAWKLYELPPGYDSAITHAAFSPDGSKFVWTERIKGPKVSTSISSPAHMSSKSPTSC